MLELDDLLIRQGAFTLRANWRLARGEKLALIGPSGAGKSTLLSVIAGFLAPTAGRVIVAGNDLASRGPAARPVSLLFQEHNLFPHLSVRQNVGLGLDPSLRLGRKDWAKVTGSLARVGLSVAEGQRRPADLSGGQRQRAALARALLRQKPLLLLDEPFAALGPGLRFEMLDLVNEIVTETAKTLIMVTHEPKDAQRIATQTALVADGVVAAPVNTIGFFANPPTALAKYLGN